jgi:penicillin V acylase-like amidase (Ntn superfamily)
MAYVSQDMKKQLSVSIKKVLKSYGVKGSISVRNHSSLVVKLSSGKLDIINNWIQVQLNQPQYSESAIKSASSEKYLSVSPLWIEDSYSGEVKDFLVELFAAMKGQDYYDNSDPMTDYFDISHYVKVEVGQYNKPYVVSA